MSDKPILFSAPMVRALLAGTKTQTRRILKPQPGADATVLGDWRLRIAVGDRLWVKETHAIVGNVDPGWVLYRASGYAEECKRHGFDNPPPESDMRWRPSIHQTRVNSRLTLHVTEARVQRLQDISEADCIAEGATVVGNVSRMGLGLNGVMVATDKPHIFAAPRTWYRELWESINGAASWALNPWVAAYTFEVKRCNISLARAA